MQAKPVLRLACAIALLSTVAPAPAATSAECRAACGTAIEGCIAWRSTALRDVEAPARTIRRKAKLIRRGCAKAAVAQCRTGGVTACDTPVACACGR